MSELYTAAELGRKFKRGKVYNQEIGEIFSPSRLEQYYKPLFRFDIVGFDEKVIHTPDGESMADRIKKDYGLRAHEIVSNLIKL